MVGVHLRELHDRAVRFARLEERFLPVRVVEVDADGLEPGWLHACERRGEVRDLEREVMLAGPVAGEEAGEEVVPLAAPTRRGARRSCRRHASPTRTCTHRNP